MFHAERPQTDGQTRRNYNTCESRRERNHLEDPGVDWRIILRWIFQEVGCEVMDWIEQIQDRDRWRVTCECGNVPSCSIKCGEFLD
jgi:hypothetical protein